MKDTRPTTRRRRWQRVAVIGVGQSTFVRAYPGSIRELAFEAYRDAMKDAGLKADQVDASVICSAPEYDKQRTPAGLMAEYLGLNPQPTFYVESVCSSSSSGLRTAYALIASGLHDVVLVLGFQKMSEITSAESQERMGRGADIQWEAPFGTMMPAYYAMYARGHMEKFGTTEEDLAPHQGQIVDLRPDQRKSRVQEISLPGKDHGAQVHRHSVENVRLLRQRGRLLMRDTRLRREG